MPRGISIKKQQEKERNLDKGAISKEPITSFDCCPQCGGTYGYYIKTITVGVLHDNTAWDHVSKQNSEMHDSLTDVWTSKYYYCSECDEPICRYDAKKEKQRFFDSLVSNSELS